MTVRTKMLTTAYRNKSRHCRRRVRVDNIVLCCSGESSRTDGLEQYHGWWKACIQRREAKEEEE